MPEPIRAVRHPTSEKSRFGSQPLIMYTIYAPSFPIRGVVTEWLWCQLQVLVGLLPRGFESHRHHYYFAVFTEIFTFCVQTCPRVLNVLDNSLVASTTAWRSRLIDIRDASYQVMVPASATAFIIFCPSHLLKPCRTCSRKNLKFCKLVVIVIDMGTDRPPYKP